jgi:hypothetical protein
MPIGRGQAISATNTPTRRCQSGNPWQPFAWRYEVDRVLPIAGDVFVATSPDALYEHTDRRAAPSKTPD